MFSTVQEFVTIGPTSGRRVREVVGARPAAVGSGVGQQSDATIILAAVIIAFTPVKNRLQAVVDRRFK